MTFSQRKQILGLLFNICLWVILSSSQFASAAHLRGNVDAEDEMDGRRLWWGGRRWGLGYGYGGGLAGWNNSRRFWVNYGLRGGNRNAFDWGFQGGRLPQSNYYENFGSGNGALVFDDPYSSAYFGRQVGFPAYARSIWT